MRLAWFSPWPPQRSGIAGRSAEVVPELCRRGMAIDVFVDDRAVPVERSPDGPPQAGACRVQSAHDFIWRNRRRQYDLVVYQIGNSRLHDFLWPYLYRWPGLAVLHDARLHHARAQAQLQHRQFDAYRDEFYVNHPGIRPELAELGVAGLGGHYFYMWPMLRSVVESSRAVATHARGAIDEIRSSVPNDSPAAGRPVEHIALGEGSERSFSDVERRDERARLGFSEAHVVFGVFGGLSADKRLQPILRVVARLRHRMPHIRLLVVGSASAEVPLNTWIADLGIANLITLAHEADDQTFDRWMASVDVSLNLRWPTALETSGPWLRALAAARASIVIALAHHADVPALDPRTWLAWPGQPGVQPITIALDVLDEEHSLELAMAGLVERPDLRHTLGEAARHYWSRTHTLRRMADDYERVLAQTAREPEGMSLQRPAVDPVGKVTGLLAALNVSNPLI